jgi:hypothetical protein
MLLTSRLELDIQFSPSLFLFPPIKYAFKHVGAGGELAHALLLRPSSSPVLLLRWRSYKVGNSSQEVQSSNIALPQAFVVVAKCL